MPRRAGTMVVAAVVAGLVLGPVDLLAQRTLPYPLADLANSSAVWALAAFGIGMWVRSGRTAPVVAGVVLLLVAVESYYLAATIALHDAASVMWSPTAMVWLLFAVLAGAVFGTGGAWACSGNAWQRLVGVALPGAVLLAEAAVLAGRDAHGDAGYRADGLRAAALDVALAAVVTLVVARTARQRLQALGVVLLLAVLGFVGFRLGGFG